MWAFWKCVFNDKGNLHKHLSRNNPEECRSQNMRHFAATWTAALQVTTVALKSHLPYATKHFLKWSFQWCYLDFTMAYSLVNYTYSRSISSTHPPAPCCANSSFLFRWRNFKNRLFVNESCMHYPPHHPFWDLGQIQHMPSLQQPTYLFDRLTCW